MRTKSLLKPVILLLIVMLVSACSAKKTDDPKTDPNLLFEDTFKRADNTVVGSDWQEVKMRNGTGSSVTTIESGDSPWSIKSNTLIYEGIGNNTYTEDYIETVKEFPINNSKVEFEIRGTASTTLGYVGPAIYWAPAVSSRLGSFQTVDNKDPLIGVQTFYSWENAGTKGIVYYLNGKIEKVPNGTLSGINAADFVKHSITIKDGKLTHEAGGTIVASYDLKEALGSDVKRHLSFDVRYYDNGIPFKVEIRNLKITVIK
ncbi:MAG: hypothetical protein WBL80_03815 [Erysipelotrichaceae bacterium]